MGDREVGGEGIWCGEGWMGRSVEGLSWGVGSGVGNGEWGMGREEEEEEGFAP